MIFYFMRQIRESFIYFLLSILAILPYSVIGEDFLDTNVIGQFFKDKHLNFVIISIFFSMIGIYKLYKKENLWRQPLPHRILSLFCGLIFVLSIGVATGYYNFSYSFQKAIDFRHHVLENFQVSRNAKYRILLLSYYETTLPGDFVYFPVSLELYEDGKPLMISQSPQKHKVIAGDTQANIYEVNLYPHKKYQFVSNTSANYDVVIQPAQLYVEIRRDRISTIQEMLSFLGIYFYLVGYIFFLFFCSGIVLVEKILLSKS